MAKSKSSSRPTKKTRRSSPGVAGRPYKRNFLKQVLARIDFAASIPELEKGVPDKIEKVIKKVFPIPEPQKQVLQRLFFSTSDGVRQSKTETQQWVYHSKDRNKLINVTADFVYVEYKKYKSFPVLQKDFQQVIDALFDVYGDIQSKRLGLRYIDNIEFPKEKSPTDWSKYLCPDLLPGLKLGDDPKTVARYFNVLEFVYDDMRMRFQFGMPNPDFPAAIRQKLFVLDYDAFCDLLLSRESIPGYLEKFHGKIRASFEQVITDGLRRVMGKPDA